VRSASATFHRQPAFCEWLVKFLRSGIGRPQRSEDGRCLPLGLNGYEAFCRQGQVTQRVSYRQIGEFIVERPACEA
jgi:hypothetical protein